MSAIGGTWHSGKNHAMTPRGRDLFEAFERYKIRIEGGRLDFVTLRATTAAESAEPQQCDVALQPPHRVTVSEPELAPLLDEYLDAARITSPAPRPLDFFALQPWIDSRPGWVAAEGEAGFAALASAGVLRADRTNRAVVPPEHPHAGRTATAYPLRGTTYLAWSPDPTTAPFLVEEEDLVLYALSFEALAAKIAGDLGLERPATRLDDDGVLACGRRALGPTHVHLFLLTRPVRMATIERLREAAGHGHAILVAPEGRQQPSGLRQLAMPRLSEAWRPMLGGIVRALRLESHVEAPVYAPPEARIVLQRATKRVWVDGVLCTAATDAHFLLLEMLATSGGQPVDSKDLAEHIAKGHQHRDTTRRTIDSLPLAIEKSFKAAKRKAPADLRSFVTKGWRGRYALTVPAYVD